MSAPVLRKMRELILYVGQRGMLSGRVGIAAVLFHSDFEAYRVRGKAITGATYVKAPMPGMISAPGNLVAAVRLGLRLGAIDHRIKRGVMRRADAEWLTEQWREGVPV